MKVPLLDLKSQYAELRPRIRKVIDEICDEQMFILGPRVEEFERRIAAYCGAEHAVGLSSGSDALLVALMALGVGPGNAVITTPYTFFATAGSIVRLGATPVLVDIDPVTFNIDPSAVRALLESGTIEKKGLKPTILLPVHLFGQVCEMDPLLKVASDYGLHIVEDAAQAIGAEYPSASGTLRAGSMGAVGCFSFFPSKNLGGFGDGGMVTTGEKDLAAEIRRIRNHGAEPKYFHAVVGGNFRLDAIQAAVLDVKLDYLENWHEARRANAARYDRAFAESCVQTPQAAYRGRGIRNYHIYNQYVVRVPDRDRVRAALADRGIGCEVYYPIPLHMQECFAGLGYKEGDFPHSEAVARETLALPVYPELTEEMQEAVVSELTAAIAEEA